MSRETHSSIARPVAVWILVTGVVAVTWAVAAASATSLTSQRVWRGTFEDLLVAVAGAALVASACWLWVVTTMTVVDVIGGRPSVSHGITRRLVLAACGVAVVAGVSSPALASGGSDDPVLAGLPFPDRAVAGAPAAPTPQPEREAVPTPAVRPGPPAASGHREPITVRPGDSLWSIARADLGPDAGLLEIDERWRALYATNRGAIGPDPDLITPGQQLRPDTDR